MHIEVKFACAMPNRCQFGCSQLIRSIHRCNSTRATWNLCISCSNQVLISTSRCMKHWTRVLKTCQSGMSPQCRPQRSGRNRQSLATRRGMHCSAYADARPPKRGASRSQRAVEVQRILLFAGPALAIPLLDPLMDFFDSIFLGQV